MQAGLGMGFYGFTILRFKVSRVLGFCSLARVN